MRKLVILNLLLFFALLGLPRLVLSQHGGTGEDCRRAGGNCRNEGTCQQGEVPDGQWDCPETVVGQECCLTAGVTPPQLTCGQSCSSPSQCPSQCNACEKEYQSGPRVCRTPGQISPDAPPAGPIETAIGPIDPTNLQGFIQSLLGIAFGVAGGIAFLLMLFGSFQIMTSSGNPEKMKAGSELITSALTGLLFIIFSVFILKLIGVTILEIPGFGQ